MSLPDMVTGVERRQDRNRRKRLQERQRFEAQMRRQAEADRQFKTDVVANKLRLDQRIQEEQDKLTELSMFEVEQLRRRLQLEPMAEPLARRKAIEKEFTFRTTPHPEIPITKRSAPLAPVYEKIGEGLHEYDKRIATPFIAASVQAAKRIGPAGITAGMTGTGAEAPKEPPINVFKAVYNEEEQQRAQDIMKDVDPVTKTYLYLILDPANMLPVVGFGPDIKNLVGAARRGGPEGIAAVRRLMSEPALKEQLVGGVTRMLRSEAGGSRFGKEAAEELAMKKAVFEAIPPAEVSKLPKEGTAHVYTAPEGSRLEWRERGKTVHILDVTVPEEARGQGRGSQLVIQALEDIQKAKPGAKVTADLNTPEGAGLMKRLGAKFEDFAGRPITGDEAIDLAKKAKGPRAIFDLGELPVPAPKPITPIDEGLEAFDQEAFDSALDGLELPRLGKKQPKRPTTYEELVAHQDDVQTRLDDLQERLDELENPDTARGQKLQDQIDELDEYKFTVDDAVDEFHPDNFAAKAADDAALPQIQGVDDLEAKLIRDTEAQLGKGTTIEGWPKPKPKPRKPRAPKPKPERGVVPYEPIPRSLVPYGEAIQPPAGPRNLGEALEGTLTDQVARDADLITPGVERPIELSHRAHSWRAKRYIVFGAEGELQTMARQEEEIQRRLAQAGIPRDEQIALHRGLSEINQRRLVLREQIDDAARGTAEQAVPGTSRAKGFTHENILPPVRSLDEQLDIAFGSSGWQRKAAGWIANLPLSPFKFIDKSLVLENSYVGRLFVAMRQLEEAAIANQEARLRILRGYANGKNLKVFDLSKEGIEMTTGREISDILENWKSYKHLFNEEQAGFVDLYNRFRLDTLEEAAKLGVKIPDAWKETYHVWRQVRGKGGEEFARALQAGARGKPSSFRTRIYETLEAGRKQGIEYNKDLMQVAEAASMNIVRHATEKAFWNALRGRGHVISRWMPAEMALRRAEGAREVLWTQRLKSYVHQSVNGRPPKPAFRDIQMQSVPSRVHTIADDVADINAKYTGRDRQNRVRAYIEEVNDMAAEARNKHNTARNKAAAFQRDFQAQRPDGRPFGLDGLVDAGIASPSEFPELGRRVFLKEDLDMLQELWKRDGHKWLEGAAQVSDVFRAGATAVDPGFWFIQGLMPIGTDVANLARGKPSAIWAKSVWRSMRNAVTNGKSMERFWARELELHGPEEISEFAQNYRALSGHGMPSEFTMALERGGLVEKVERHVPGLKQGQPFTRASNAFAFYLDSAAWETWKALRPLAGDNPQKLAELGAFIRNSAGKTSTRGLGHSAMQRAAERAWIAWAPAYTRGTFAVMVKALTDPTSFGGRQALKSLAGLGAAATLMGTAAIMSRELANNGGRTDKLDWDKVGDDVRKFWDVTNPSTFMSVRIGDNNFGIGGAYRANVAMVSRLMKAGYNDPASYSPLDLESGHLVNFKHPFLRAWRSKASPLTGEAFNLISGEDYLGFQLDSPGQYFRLGEDITPFAVQSYLQAEGGKGGKLGAGLAEWFGFRSFPVRKVDLYHEAAEKEAGEKWATLDDSGYINVMRDNPDQFPETARRWEEYQQELRDKGNEFQAVRDQVKKDKEERDNRLAELAQGIQWGRVGGGEMYKTNRKEILAEYRRSYQVAAEAKGINLDDMKQVESADEKVVSQYYELELEDFVNPDGSPDFDTFYAEKQKLYGQMSDLAQQAVDHQKLDYSRPEVVDAEKRRMAAVDDVKHWYDFSKYKGLDKEQSAKVDEILTKATEFRAMAQLGGKSVDRREIISFFIQSGLVDPKVGTAAFLLTFSGLEDMVKNPEPDKWVMSHPDLMVFYPFLWDTLDDDQKLVWQQMYALRK